MFIFLLLVAIVGATSPRRNPEFQKCGVNEKFYEDPCPPNNCDISYTTYTCEGVKRKPGCDCIENYLRYNGTCIPNEKCPPPPTATPTCGPNEKFYDPYPCPRRNCDIAYTTYKCPPPGPPESGCDCIDNYLRQNGTCIPNNDCRQDIVPPQQDECPPNEVMGECGFQCPNAFCDDGSGLILLCKPPRDCAPGCICKEGYKRTDINNGTSTCIPAEDCRLRTNSKCGVSEKFYKIKPCPPNNCDISYTTYNCDGAPQEPGCDCAENYLRYNGTCILNEKCPPPGQTCGPNEIYYEKKPCPPNNCPIPYRDYRCDEIPVESGCDCAENYMRNTHGFCVKKDECPTEIPKECPANERLVQCKVPCPTDYCPVDDRRAIPQCSPPHPCRAGCICELGYKRKYRNDPTSACIPAEKCPKPVLHCGPDEYYEPCSYPCPPQNCSSIWSRYACDQNQTCSPACRCKNGYKDDTTGVCKTVFECMGKTCGPNETYYGEKPCPPLRCDISYTEYNCTDIPREEGCDCKENYLRNNGTCILNEECPPPKPAELECGLDEYYEPCSYPCPPQNCSSIWSRYACDQNQTCSPACRCRNGFRDDTTGVCKTVFECMGKTCGPNETYYGEKPCPPLRCDISYTEYNCTDIPREEGCDCKENYLRNNGTCILNEECPPPKPAELECGPDEYYEPCSYPCPPQNCSSIWSRYACDQNQTCSPACRCKNGFRDDTTGVCKTVFECMGKTCGPNETYYGEKPCPPLKCDISYTEYNCADIPREEGCDCKENYLRNNGTCILNEECPPPKPAELECGPDEYYEPCSYPCPPQTCASIYSKYACTLNQTCAPACRCKNGLLRDNKTGVCKTVFECMGKTCGPNETYYGEKPCPPLRCEISYTEYNCADIPREEGCDCKKNYLRYNGTCILNEECPPPPVHEPPADECTTTRGPTRSKIRPPPDNVDNHSCAQQHCGKNETYALCSPRCPEEYCPPDDNPGPVCDAPIDCPPGCACKPNYLRRRYFDDNTCILARDCPRVECTRENEVWNACSSPCLNESCDFVCDEPASRKKCDSRVTCVPRCVCTKGHCRNADNICVPAKECPLKKKGCPK